MSANKIIGHAKQLNDICNIIKKQKTNRTFLFSGKSGIGKKKIAIEMAKFILGEKIPQTDVLCYDDDVISDMINKRTHPDFVFMSTLDSDISISTYRDFILKIFKKPVINKKKVLLIDGVEQLNKNVFNAMLKTFEEPPIDTTIILIASDISDIPATLISRCTHLRFQKLSLPEIKSIIKGYQYNAKDIDKIIEISDGSAGTVEKIIQGDLWCVYDEFEAIFNLVQNKQKQQALQKIVKIYETYKLKEHTKIVRLFFIKNMQRLLQLGENSDINIHKIVAILSSAETLQLDLKTIISTAIDLLSSD